MEPLGSVGIDLTKDQRIARYKKMKAAAAAKGVPNNAYLLAGIAYAETGLAHCWSEATWACKGPNSSDCGGGPVIAGAGDGPCSAQQGGLGMFQFDAGTYSQTLKAYGSDVLTVGDSAVRAMQLLGKPDFKEPVESGYGGYQGERWQYQRDDGHILTVTVISGKVSEIQDRTH